MAKSNIIIHIADGINNYDALAYIQEVIRSGRISNNDSYCSVTTFKDGVIVYADKKKSDIFTVTRRLIQNDR